jgi:hypothetical protein
MAWRSSLFWAARYYARSASRSRVQEKQPGATVRHSPQRCPPACLHPRPLYGDASRQYAPTCRCGETTGDNAHFPGEARGDLTNRASMKSLFLQGWQSDPLFFVLLALAVICAVVP